MKKLYSIFCLSVCIYGGDSINVKADDSISQVAFEKMKQYAYPLRTIDVELTYDVSIKDKNFIHRGRYRIKADIAKNLLYLECQYPQKNDSEFYTRLYIAENSQTSIGLRKEKGKKVFSNIVVFKTNKKIDLPLCVEEILTYNTEMNLPQGTNSIKTYFPLLANENETKFRKSLKRKNNGVEDVLVYSPSPKSIGEEVYSSLVFSEKTGALLEKRLLRFEKKNNELLEHVLNRRLMSNFFVSNGVLFPDTFIIEGEKGAKMRFQINKKTAKINYPFNENEFVPKIPGGATVYDEINGIRYTTPIFGNAEATKELEKELDAYFKSADDVK